MEEIWKPVAKYEQFYEASSFGRIRSIGFIYNKNGKYFKRKSPKIINGGKDKDGYILYIFCSYGKHHTVKGHRIIAETFIPNPKNLPCVNHKDENKANNSVSNLEWCDTRYNANYGTKSKRLSASLRNHPQKSKAVVCLSNNGEYITRFPSAKEAQRATGIGNISSVCNKNSRYKTAGGFRWEWEINYKQL